MSLVPVSDKSPTEFVTSNSKNHYNNFSITILREKATLCPLYKELSNYFSRCHTVAIITLLIQEMFPTANTMEELTKQISQLSQNDRISKIDYIKKESGRNYKISQGVSNKLKVLFDFNIFLNDLVSSKKRKAEEKQNEMMSCNKDQNRKRKKRDLTETTILPIYTQTNIKTNYVIQMKENQVHSISFQDPEHMGINLPIPYNISTLDETTFVLKENTYLISKKKNNCINHQIDLTEHNILKSPKYYVKIIDAEEGILLQISSCDT